MQIVMSDFITALLAAIADFLLTEPVIYFTGMVMLIFTISIVKRIIERW